MNNVRNTAVYMAGAGVAWRENAQEKGNTGKVMEMASRLFQSIVLQMKDTVDRTIGIVDASGAVVACTDLPRIGEMREEAITELGFAGEIVRFGGYTYHTTGDRSSRLEYAVFVQGED